ncbi:hypothetical protein [Alcaligenes aquatilis]|uniref:hypothetical protein n=1 Tax=Alcaligenes aquatilis TaxID=323284 RepID=UPI003F921A0E
MSESKYQELFEKLKNQEKAFNEYWMALRAGVRDFRNKIRELMGYPASTYADQNNQARHWVALAAKDGADGATELDLVRHGGDNGTVEFSVGLTVGLPGSPSDMSIFWYKYSIRKINNKIELRSLSRKDEIFYLETEDGLKKAAEWLIDNLDRDLLETPQSLWESEHPPKKASFF